eukprot:5406864-Prymnesium_polylepis.1
MQRPSATHAPLSISPCPVLHPRCDSAARTSTTPCSSPRGSTRSAQVARAQGACGDPPHPAS